MYNDILLECRVKINIQKQIQYGTFNIKTEATVGADILILVLLAEVATLLYYYDTYRVKQKVESDAAPILNL